jgi:hypothetical protein
MRKDRHERKRSCSNACIQSLLECNTRKKEASKLLSSQVAEPFATSAQIQKFLSPDLIFVFGRRKNDDNEDKPREDKQLQANNNASKEEGATLFGQPVERDLQSSVYVLSKGISVARGDDEAAGARNGQWRLPHCCNDEPEIVAQ